MDIVATYASKQEAEALKKRLQDRGVHAVLHDESNLQLFWFMSRPKASVKIDAPDGEFDKAMGLLKEWAGDPVVRNAVHCPECASTRVEYPHMTRKFATPTLFLDMLHLVGLFPRECYCLDCHYTWEFGKEKAAAEEQPG